MRRTDSAKAPADAEARRGAAPTIVYPVGQMPPFDTAFYAAARAKLEKTSELTVPPRDARAFAVPAGQLFRIVSIEGPQVGDLNLWNAARSLGALLQRQDAGAARNPRRTGDRLWSTMPYLRPMATISHDTLGWYGWDADGAGVHDVIGTRCDPYTNLLLNGDRIPPLLPLQPDARAGRGSGTCRWREGEHHVHDVLNVFMCTGFTRDTHQYFMKASPCGPATSSSSSPRSICLVRSVGLPRRRLRRQTLRRCCEVLPLKVEIYRTGDDALAGWRPPSPNGYSRTHGVRSRSMAPVTPR